MYQIDYSSRFRKQFKRLCFSGSFPIDKYRKIINLLSESGKLPFIYLDHRLKGEFGNYRECHVRPNLLLIYEIDEDKKEITIAAIGSHGELFD